MTGTGQTRAAGALAALAALSVPATALELADCTRTTHPSHAGEEGHRDLGGGRVTYTEWWSQEGVYTDLVVADCRAARKLTARAQEERIGPRPPFDRTAKARAILKTQAEASPSLFSLERLAEALHPTARDIRIEPLTIEPCACAALYPGASPALAPYEGEK